MKKFIFVLLIAAAATSCKKEYSNEVDSTIECGTISFVAGPKIVVDFGTHSETFLRDSTSATGQRYCKKK